jgi:hypothetical protein
MLGAALPGNLWWRSGIEVFISRFPALACGDDAGGHRPTSTRNGVAARRRVGSMQVGAMPAKAARRFLVGCALRTGSKGVRGRWG